MEQDIWISVIIPVYNMEPFLKRCLDSIVGQEYRYLEIIVIDDGSEDGSPEIIRGYAKQDSRIKVITKANAGIGSAISDGLAAATGDYISFVDADDYCGLGMYKALVGRIAETGSDIVQFGIKRFSENGKTIRVELPDFDYIEGNEEFIRKHFEEIKNPGLAFRVCRRSLFDNIEIPPQRCGVDEMITPQILIRALSASAIREPFYHLLVRSTSISRAPTGNSYENMLAVYDRMLALSNVKNETVYRYIIIKYLNYLDAAGLAIYLRDGGKQVKLFLNNRCRLRDYYNELKGSVEWKRAGVKFDLRMRMLMKCYSLYYLLRAAKLKLGRKYEY